MSQNTILAFVGTTGSRPSTCITFFSRYSFLLPCNENNFNENIFIFYEILSVLIKVKKK